MISEALKNFPSQFTYKPVIENAEMLSRFHKFVVVGMGGSHLAADLLRILDPYLDIIIHQDYGLPVLSPKEFAQRIIILSSYSGNTEEVLDAFEYARKRKFPITIITVGGKLLELAKKYHLPYIQIPDMGIQPRLALGFSFKAFLKIIGNEDALKETKNLASSLSSLKLKKSGHTLARQLYECIPIIYSSGHLAPLAYIWKIALNETSKIPSFCNIFPELNHNEMIGFDGKKITKKLIHPFSCIILKSADDPPRIQVRMKILKQLYSLREISVIILNLHGKNIFQKIFSSILLAHWTAYSLARHYGVPAEQVSMIEEFKKRLRLTRKEK